MTRLVQVLQIVAGLLLIGMTLADAIGTLVVARGLTARWLPTRGFYSTTWRVWRALARRLDGRRREAFLSAYAPLTLLGLLAIWLLGLLLGWALVYLAAETSLKGADGFLSLVYYSGTCLFTLGFGDILATNDLLRVLALVEAGTGVATMALAISYFAGSLRRLRSAGGPAPHSGRSVGRPNHPLVDHAPVGAGR